MPWPRLWSLSSSQASTDTSDDYEKDYPPQVKANLKSAKAAVSEVAEDILASVPKTETTDGSPLAVFSQPETIAATFGLTTLALLTLRGYKLYLRRIPTATDINPAFFRKRSLLGQVTRVGDGDNFRIYHTPGGRLAGWGWLPGRKVPEDKGLLKDNTIHVRLAGVDAPEAAHFGRPSQPGSREALSFLTNFLINRRVRCYIHKADQYSRCVATVYVWRWSFFPIPIFWRRDVGLQMLRNGWATVYEAKQGAEYGGPKLEQKYRLEEDKAKKRNKGIWGLAKKQRTFESPREYKRKHSGDASDNGKLGAK